MKKFLFPIMLGALTAIPAMSQDTDTDKSGNQAYFGLRIGVDVTCPSQITEDNVGIGIFKDGAGVELGGIYNVPIAGNFYIEPGLKFYYNTYSVKDDFLDILEGGSNINSISFRKFGMRIPVMAGYHFDFSGDFKLFLFTGPELEIGFSAKEYLKGHNIEMSAGLYGEDGGMKRVNLSWGYGVGLSYRNLYFAVSGDVGLLNMINDPGVKYYENRATFSIGYNF